MQEYVTLESAATAIKVWQPAFVPGLLQTAEYVRALRRSPITSAVMNRQPDDEFVAARLARQQRLSDDPPLSLRTVIYEAVLRNLPGGKEEARGQLDHLAKMADFPNVALQVFPFSAGTHFGLNGSFNIISFADIVYVEAPFAQRWVEGGEGAAAYDELFEMIAEHSLDQRESVLFLHKLRKEL
jgi:hypothetical protein